MSDMQEITFTLNLVDPRPDKSLSERYNYITKSLLDVLKVWKLNGTFFCSDECVQDNPILVKKIASHGHEVALYSSSSRDLANLSPAKFKQQVQQSKLILEDLVEHQISGFRAASFSLTKDTLWIPEILTELGFLYSSSVLPAKNYLFGFSQAPKHPFKWPCGLTELPVPTTTIGFKDTPYLGGAYFRYFPNFLIKSALRKNDQKMSWFYCHPYDFDAGQPFYQMKGMSFLSSIILWINRKSAIEKMRKLYQENEIGSQPFAKQIENGFYENLETFFYK